MSYSTPPIIKDDPYHDEGARVSHLVPLFDDYHISSHQDGNDADDELLSSNRETRITGGGARDRDSHMVVDEDKASCCSKSLKALCSSILRLMNEDMRQ